MQVGKCEIFLPHPATAISTTTKIYSTVRKFIRSREIVFLTSYEANTCSQVRFIFVSFSNGRVCAKNLRNIVSVILVFTIDRPWNDHKQSVGKNFFFFIFLQTQSNYYKTIWRVLGRHVTATVVQTCLPTVYEYSGKNFRQLLVQIWRARETWMTTDFYLISRIFLFGIYIAHSPRSRHIYISSSLIYSIFYGFK